MSAVAGIDLALITLGLILLAIPALVQQHYERTGYYVGFKPAGGIRTAKDACLYLALMREELGIEWQKNDLFRIGASGLLTDIERQLHHGASGDYAAGYYMAMS